MMISVAHSSGGRTRTDMNAPDFAIVADDLTGAADSCASLAESGHRTAVFFEGESGDVGAFGNFGAVAFDTDSRCHPPEEARRRVLEAGRKARPAAIAYKKIDSTLRGNLAVETAAMMEAAGRGRAVVAPAFPHAGRATVGGTQLLRGVPVHKTELARDPKTPARESHLPTILSDLGSVGRLSLEDLDDPATIRRAIEENRVVVADAVEDSHLRSLVRAVGEPSRILWVGSAGLASALASALAPASERREVGGVAPPACRGVLVVVGSLSGVSRSQLRCLERSGEAVLVSAGDPSGVFGAGEVLRAGGCVALHSPAGDGRLSSGEVSGMLAEVVAGFEGCFGSLVMTGGDTAVAVSRRLGARGIEVFGEVEPGVPFGRLVGRSPYRVVTKAGGFGSPGTLLDAVGFLSGVERGVKG